MGRWAGVGGCGRGGCAVRDGSGGGGGVMRHDGSGNAG